MGRRTCVLIAGGGPVGLSASVMLGRLGVPSLLVERREGASLHPKATVVNIRSAELLRQWGVEDEVRERGLPLERSAFVSWFTRLSGREIGALSLIDEDPQRFAGRMGQSPTLPLICPQSEVERVLAGAAAELESSELLFSTELVGFVQGEQGLVVTCADRSSGERFKVHADYLLAADGPQSPVRRMLGIGQDGFEGLGEMVNIHFAADISAYTDRRPSVLYWIVNQDVRGVIHALDGFERWLLNVVVPPDGGADAFDTGRCAELVRAAVGDPELEHEILSIKPWTLCALVAERYREGRILLAGDAAHQFPPTGGFGMNTGIQDAHNLAWKLAAVVDGRAPESLLDSYEAERRGIAQFNCEQTLVNAGRMVDTGLFFDTGDEAGTTVEADNAEADALRKRLSAAIPHQREHFVFDGQDLGFSYSGRGVIPDGSEPPVGEDPIVDYVPSAHPGARAPHLWLERDGDEISTLDLFEHDFVLLAGPAGGAWRDAAGLVANAPIPRTYVVGDGNGLGDPNGEFLELYGIPDDGAVLVRPDGHVACRFRSRPVDPRAALEDALQRLGLTAAPPAEAAAS